MTPEEVIGAWQKVIDELQGEAGVIIMQKIGHDAQAGITGRITETGKDADGQGFQEKKPYSPSYLAYKMGLAEDPKTGKKLASNRYKGFVDFQLTGEAWKDVQSYNDLNGGTKGQATTNSVMIKALSPANQEKFNKNAVRWGTDIIEMNQAEIDRATKRYIDETVKLFKQVGL